MCSWWTPPKPTESRPGCGPWMRFKGRPPTAPGGSQADFQQAPMNLPPQQNRRPVISQLLVFSARGPACWSVESFFQRTAEFGWPSCSTPMPTRTGGHDDFHCRGDGTFSAVSETAPPLMLLRLMLPGFLLKKPWGPDWNSPSTGSHGARAL